MLLYIFCVNVTFRRVTTITDRKREPNFVYTYLACLMIFFRVKTSFMYFAETSKLKQGDDLVVSFYLTVLEVE